MKGAAKKEAISAKCGFFTRILTAPHVGARYYDAQVGRFITRDTYLSQKPYIYCEHNPVNAVDPSGHCVDKGKDKPVELPKSVIVIPGDPPIIIILDPDAPTLIIGNASIDLNTGKITYYGPSIKSGNFSGGISISHDFTKDETIINVQGTYRF